MESTVDRPRARLGISDAVTFHGHIDDEAKHLVMQQAWVHVLPSRKEGWGLAVIEAAQHAVPTIGYRSSGGLADSIIDGVTGVLVDDHAGLVSRLEQLLADPVLRDQLGAKAQVRSAEFSWKQSAEAMRSVLESVAAGVRVSGVVYERRRRRPSIAKPTAPPSSVANQTRCATTTPPADSSMRPRCCRRRGTASGRALDTQRAVAPKYLRPYSCRRVCPARQPASPRRPRRSSIRVGAGQQQSLHITGPVAFAEHRCPGDRQIAGRQHVGTQPARQRIQHRRRAGPGESPHGVGRQHRDFGRLAVDRRRDGRPVARGSAPTRPFPLRPKPSRAVTASAPHNTPARPPRAATSAATSTPHPHRPARNRASPARPTSGRPAAHPGPAPPRPRRAARPNPGRSPAQRVSAPTPAPAPAAAAQNEVGLARQPPRPPPPAAPRRKPA